MNVSPHKVLKVIVREHISHNMLNSTWLGLPMMILKEDGRSSTRNLAMMEWQFWVLWIVSPISIRGIVTTPNVGKTSRPMLNVGPELCLNWESRTFSLFNISLNMTLVLHLLWMYTQFVSCLQMQALIRRGSEWGYDTSVPSGRTITYYSLCSSCRISRAYYFLPADPFNLISIWMVRTLSWRWWQSLSTRSTLTTRVFLSTTMLVFVVIIATPFTGPLCLGGEIWWLD